MIFELKYGTFADVGNSICVHSFRDRTETEILTFNGKGKDALLMAACENEHMPTLIMSQMTFHFSRLQVTVYNRYGTMKVTSSVQHPDSPTSAVELEDSCWACSLPSKLANGFIAQKA